MKYNQTIRNLFELAPRAFQCLHSIRKMDFEKDFYISENIGKFTYKKVTKLIEELTGKSYIRRNDFNAFIIFKPIGFYYREAYLVEVSSYDFRVTREEIGCGGISYRYDIDTFWRKSDFEKQRKNENLHWFLIVQDGEYISHRIADKTVTSMTRLKVLDVGEYVESAGSSQSYVARINVKLVDRPNDDSFEVYDTYGKVPIEKVHTILDKSGYYKADIKREYQRRINKIKSDKSAAKAAQYDNTEKLAEIEGRIKAINEKVIQLINKDIADIPYGKISNVCTYLSWCKSDVETLRKNNFSSMESINSNISYIESKLRDAENKLSE